MFAVSFSCILNKITWKCRSSRSQMFLKIGVLKNFNKFHWKTAALEFLLNNVEGPHPWKDPNTSVFLWNLWNFNNSNFLQYTSGSYFLRKAIVAICWNIFQRYLLHSKSLITCYLRNDKLIWKCIHLPKICSHRTLL